MAHQRDATSPSSRSRRSRTARYRATVWLAFLTSAAVASPASAEIYLRQKATSVALSTATCPCTITAAWPAPTLAGSTLVAVLGAYSLATFGPPASQGWTSAVRNTYGNPQPKPVVEVFYAPNASSVSGASTWTVSTAVDTTIVIMELGGAATSSVLDYTNTGKGFSLTADSGDPGNVATTQADEFAIGAFDIDLGGSTFSSSSLTNGYTFEQTVNGTSTNSMQVMDKTLTATAPQRTGANVTGTNAAWVGVMATFKALTPVTKKYWRGTAGADCGTAAWKSYDDAACPTSAAPTTSQTAIWNAGSTSCTFGSTTTIDVLQMDSTYPGTVTVGPAVSLTSNNATTAATVNGGTLSAGSGRLTFKGGAAVGGAGTLNLTSTGTVAVGGGKSLVIDGTLKATDSTTIPTIQVDGTGTYSFTVGSTSTATPVLNIDGLKVMNTGTNGMYINSVVGSSTTFSKFDNIAFSNGTSGGQLLQIYAPSLYLASKGCTFDAGVSATTSYTVRLTGDGTSNGETRAVFGGASCSSTFSSCQASKVDGDSNNDGVADTPVTNGGSVVQFVGNLGTDTSGTLVGFPSPAFDWNTFTYYATYAAYNNASGTSPTIYVRDSSGAAKYSWTGAAGETMVGTPRWTTVGPSHYVYVAMASGKVYRLVDDGSSSLVKDSSWTTNPFDCGCAITTPLSMDTSNLYWGGTGGGAQQIWTLGQSSESQPTGSPLTITPTITSAAPLVWTSAGTTSLFVATAGHLVKVDLTSQIVSADNASPGSASIWGRLTMATANTNRILAGDDAGVFWSIDPNNFGGTTKQWSYTVTSDAMKSSPYYDHITDTVMFGTEGGKVVALTAAGVPLTGYPYSPGTSSDVIRSAPLYNGGVLAVGTNTGKLFFLDRNNGTTGPALIREYYFGPTETVSGIAFDANTNRYVVTTSDSSVNDGKLYDFDLIADPTPSFL